MENASTKVPPPLPDYVKKDYPSVYKQTDASEQSLQVRLSESERRPSAVENKYVKKILEFFERIADRFKSWKESRNEAALKRSGRRAVSTITRGLATSDFRKVYQGLKRLHNGEQKLSDMGGKVGKLDKDIYIRDARQSVVSECLPDEKNSNASEKAKNLKRFAESRNGLVDQYSDSKTLFHRMLTGLKGAHLIPSSYVDLRTQRIEAQDDKIKESLESMQDSLQKQNRIRSLKKQADDGGSTFAMYELGTRYRDGDGVKKNLEEALRWFKKADDGGHIKARGEVHKLMARELSAELRDRSF